MMKLSVLLYWCILKSKGFVDRGYENGPRNVLESDAPNFETMVRALAEGNSLPATVGSCRSTKMQVVIGWIGDWLDRGATPQCRLVVLHLWDQLHVTECQLDELWSFVHPKEDHFLMVHIDRETDSDAWIWVVFSPVWRLILAFGVSKRLQDCADSLVDRVTAHQFTSIGSGLTGFLPPLGLGAVSNDSYDVFAMVTCRSHKLI